MNQNLSLKEIVELLDSGATMTVERYEDVLRHVFSHIVPYVVAIDKSVRETQYGEIDIKLTVRAGEVEKMQFWQGKQWLRPKDT